MMIAKVSERGQISIPASARKKLGIKPKSTVKVEIRDDEIAIKPLKSISDVAGIFKEHAKGQPTDWEEERAIAMEAVAREVMDESGD